MATLNSDVILHIGSFMKPKNVVSLTCINKDIRGKSDQLLKNMYEKTFGTIKTQQLDKKIHGSLLRFGEKQPDANVNHNIYQIPPSNWLERWKWIIGVENSLDKEVQENYKNNISLLENTQATSIIQLKNQMHGFWHLDRQIKDYAKFKSEEKARANKIFFACLRLLFKLLYKTSITDTGKKLELRSREHFAKIGGFNLENKDYDVVAFHLLGDEKSADNYTTYEDDTHRKFDSLSYGRTYIGIFEREQPHSVESLGHYGPNPNFSVLIGREAIGSNLTISSEEDCQHGKEAVSNNKRHLSISNRLEYRGRTTEAEGSDRLLDQKLTQIMIEMTMQNKEIISLQALSVHDYLPVLIAGGFKGKGKFKKRKEIIKALNTFRSNEKNKLFPPYEDYSGISTIFNTKNFTKKNVHYSKGVPEAWSDIIQSGPILNPKSAILPEYWARKPNIKDEK